jgi:hypothetical protein
MIETERRTKEFLTETLDDSLRTRNDTGVSEVRDRGKHPKQLLFSDVLDVVQRHCNETPTANFLVER